MYLCLRSNREVHKINLQAGKKVYFASDFHLGAPDRVRSLVRERKIIAWLDSIQHDAQVVFLCGDLFDFWFEYNRVVPKGYVRFLGKLAELQDQGISLVIFTGNHDMWMRDYLEIEVGATIYREPQQFLIGDKKFLVGHGDGLGPGDYAYKFLKVLFESKVCRFLFGRLLHANLGQFLGYSWASHSWKKHEKENDVYNYESPEKEILFQYCKETESKEHHDYYVFGHRHYKLHLKVNEISKYINLGDWIRFDSFGVFDGNEMKLEVFGVQ